MRNFDPNGRATFLPPPPLRNKLRNICIMMRKILLFEYIISRIFRKVGEMVDPGIEVFEIFF